MSSRFLQKVVWALVAEVLSFYSTLARNGIVCYLVMTRRVKIVTWSLGSDSWRHFTIMSIASRQSKGCDLTLALEPLGASKGDAPFLLISICAALWIMRHLYSGSLQALPCAARAISSARSACTGAAFL